MEGVVEEGADAGAGDWSRVRAGALHRELGGAVQVFLAQADVGRAAVRVSRGRAMAGAHSVLRWRGNRSLASASSEPAAASRCERRLRN
jgi:hypothetical protein